MSYRVLACAPMKRKSQLREKVSISLPTEMAAWLRRASEKRYVSVSHMVKEALMPAFERRHAK